MSNHYLCRMSDKRIFGLIGNPLGHSFSRGYFNEKFSNENIHDAEYKNFGIPSLSYLDEVLNTPGLCGLNVTIPYKEEIIPFLDILSPEASEVGAVNTIRITKKNGEIIREGFNTDVYGFSMSLKPFLLNLHERALILGSGGGSKAVQYVLEKLGIEYRVVERERERGEKDMYGNPDVSAGGMKDKVQRLKYRDLNEYILSSHLLIINTTPLGMHPSTELFPDIPYEFISENHLLYDLIYNPEETVFLRKGREKKAVTLNGISMLRLQAEKSWQIWNEK